jgi:hypothetical protein
MTRAVAIIRRSYAGFTREAQQFFAWWMLELREIGAACIRRLLPGQSLRFVVDLREAPRTVRHSVGPDTDTKSVMLDAQGELPPAHHLWPEKIPRGARAEIILPSAHVLTGDLLLPAAGERELQAMMALQFERKLPLPMDQLYVDWKIVGRTENGLQRVLFATAHRTIVERLRDGVRAWGWRVVAVRGAGDAMQMNLLPAATQRISVRLERRDRILTWVATCLAGLYGLIVAGQWIYERYSLTPLLEQGHAQIATLAKERTRLTSQTEPLIAIRGEMQRLSATEALAAVSSVITAPSWVYQAQIVSQPEGTVAMVLEGYAPSSAAVVDAMQGSGRFDRVDLVEAASAALGQDGERFQIKAQLPATSVP